MFYEIIGNVVYISPLETYIASLDRPDAVNYKYGTIINQKIMVFVFSV